MSFLEKPHGIQNLRVWSAYQTEMTEMDSSTSGAENVECVQISNHSGLEHKSTCGLEGIDATVVRLESISNEDKFQNPFISLPTDSELNPNGPRFNARAWMQNWIAFTSQYAQRYTPMTASICFRNLEVHAFGALNDYQKTVGNVLLEIGSLWRWMGKRPKQKVQILKGFDGVVGKGETLIVLGCPGSGCTTLLKTIAGDTDGLFIGLSSKLIYQGLPAQVMHKRFRGEATYVAENGESKLDNVSFAKINLLEGFENCSLPILFQNISTPLC